MTKLQIERTYVAMKTNQDMCFPPQLIDFAKKKIASIRRQSEKYPDNSKLHATFADDCESARRMERIMDRKRWGLPV